MALLAAAALTACGSSSSSQSSAASTKSAKSGSGPFTVLYIGDLSGETKLLGSEELDGMKAAATYVNQTGGVDGHRVAIVTANDGGTASTAVSVLLRYLSGHSAPNMVWAGSESGETAALLPVLAKRHLLSVATTDGSQMLKADSSAKYPDQFSVLGSDAPLDAQAAMWLKRHGAHKVGILQETLDYTASETPFMSAALKKVGLPGVIVQVPATATDYTPELSQLRSDGADAIYAELLPPASGYALKARAGLAWKAPLVGDEAFSAVDLTTLVPAADLDGVHLAVAYDSPADADSPGVAMFKKYYAPFGAPVAGISTPSAAWDGLVVVRAAAKQAGSASPSVIAATLQHLKAPAETSPFTNAPHLGYTSGDHENALAVPSDYPIITPGPLKNGQIASRAH
jgi:branched-chain amino acid transport system substrate-binding protein